MSFICFRFFSSVRQLRHLFCWLLSISLYTLFPSQASPSKLHREDSCNPTTEGRYTRAPILQLVVRTAWWEVRDKVTKKAAVASFGKESCQRKLERERGGARPVFPLSLSPLSTLFFLSVFSVSISLLLSIFLILCLKYRRSGRVRWQKNIRRWEHSSLV